MPLITDLARIKHKKGSFYLDLNEWQGAKESQFYSLPFEQAGASMY